MIAQRLAEAVSGVPSFSHPRAQSGLRQTFDGTYYYLETLRGRPEWVLDLTRYQFPPLEDTAAEIIGVAPADVSCDPHGMRLAVGPGIHLEVGFVRHEVVGNSWWSSLSLHCPQISGPLADDLASITWRLFEDPQTNLLGGWSHHGDALTFQQWNITSEARNQKQLGSYQGRHTVVDLWGFTSTLSDVLAPISQTPMSIDRDGEQRSDLSDRADHIVAAIAEKALPAMTGHHSADEKPADRRLLWLEHRQTLTVAAFFNPMGPTVVRTEICALPDGTEYLVHFRRHPLAPCYCALGPVAADEDGSQIDSEATDLLISRSLPNVLALWDNMESTPADVPDSLRRRVLEVAEGAGEGSLAADAAWIEQTMGNPWEHASIDQSEANRVRAAAQQEAATHPASDGGFAAWWKQVSCVDNVIANFRCLPDAWDGALNTQKVFGLWHFDVAHPTTDKHPRFGRASSPCDYRRDEPEKSVADDLGVEPIRVLIAPCGSVHERENSTRLST